jgi:selenide,water dikinase
MVELNRSASEIALALGIRAGTDVTGFGLLGHLGEMVQQSGVTAEVEVAAVPIFDEALDYVRRDIVSGAIERNREYASDFVTVADGVDPALETVLYDPQTSGGLLLAVPRKRAGLLLRRLKAKGVESAAVIGRVTAKSEGNIIIR